MIEARTANMRVPLKEFQTQMKSKMEIYKLLTIEGKCHWKSDHHDHDICRSNVSSFIRRVQDGLLEVGLIREEEGKW